MLPNTDLKDIMLKTQTTDFFIACKESRIEKNTSFYGCFYLGPFDDSLSQTLANDLRRTLLSELTGLAITSIEIEGVLHKFSSLPGMKESVLDLICNLQNIVLKKTTSTSFIKTNLNSASGASPLTILKKTYIGFLNVSGPRVIFAKDLKLPAGLQCVDPNQYIATLAEDGILNIKFNINEGKNFIKQKSNNLDVNVLKKRNMLLRWSKTINVSEETKNFKKITNKKLPNKIKSLSGNAPQGTFIFATSQRSLTSNEHLRSKNAMGKTFTSISNPIPLDAVFMPVTKINCIIEENNLYSLGTSDTLNPFGPEGKSKDIKSHNSQYNNKQLKKDTIYQTCFILTNKLKTNQNIKFLPFGVNIPGLTINTQKKLVGNLTKVFNNFGDDTKNINICNTPLLGLIPYIVVTNGIDERQLNFEIKGEKELEEQNRLSLDMARKGLNNYMSTKDFIKNSSKNFSKIKTFLGTKNAKNSQIYLSQQAKIEKRDMSQKIFSSNAAKLNWCLSAPSVGTDNWRSSLDYTNVLKLKPLPKKSHLIIEIWTNGSIHPRHALYQSFAFLTNNFLKLQTVKMLGARFRSELAYTNIKYSLLKPFEPNFNTNKRINQAPSAIKRLQRAKSLATPNSMVSKGLNKSFTAGGKILDTQKSQNFLFKSAEGLGPLSILKISLRSYTLLKKAGIKNLNDLLLYTRKDLLNIKNFGVKSLTEIETSLSVLGLKLKN